MVEESDINEWVEKIGKTELPILNQTNNYITSTETYLKSHASDIAKAILHDPNMTAKILRLANSVFFNTTQAKINTVSKAVVFLGYDAIRSICFSTAIFEKLVAGKASQRVLSTIARSIHAAVQAKLFADVRKEKHTEEVFIAALLYNIGELSFWCLDSPEASVIEKSMVDGKDFSQVQKEILGFNFNELTSALTNDWQISDVLTEALSGNVDAEGKSQSILLGYETVQQIEQGWNSKKGRRLMGLLEDYTGLESKKLSDKIKENTQEAVSVIREFGMSDALEFIPGSAESIAKEKKLEAQKKEKLRSDPETQVAILSELTTLHGAKVDVNQVVQLALNGIVRGGGMDRAIAALKNPKLSLIKGKFVVEKVGSGARDKFDFPIVQRDGNIYDKVINKFQVLWVNAEDKALYNQEECQLIMRRMGVDEFIVGPMMVHGKGIGLIYADRFEGEYRINDADFDTFNLFVKQSAICLQALGD